MPPSLPEEGEGEGGAAPHGPGIAAWMQPMPGGGWHGSLLHERGKGRGSRHAIELYRLFFINRPHRSAKSRQCLLVLGQGLRLAVLLARWPCPVAMPRGHAPQPCWSPEEGHKLYVMHTLCCMGRMCYSCLKVPTVAWHPALDVPPTSGWWCDRSTPDTWGWTR